MRSRHVDYYNHDNLAHSYDADVLRTDDPIREGYEQALDWVIANAGITASSTVLELGSGTGNLTKRIESCRRIVCVDISTKMDDLAVSKTAHLSDREFVLSDVLEYVVKNVESFDAIISTYTLHHLTEEEKMTFLTAVAERLSPGGTFIVGDLMTESTTDEAATIAYFRSIGDTNTAEDMEEEFFWYVNTAEERLTSLGLTVETARYSRLSWCIKADKCA